MSRFRWPVLVLIAVLVGGGLGAAVWAVWVRDPDRLPTPRSVPAGDLEVAWVNNATSGEAWALFVIGVKRAEMPVNGVPSELTVDDARAFPGQSTAVPEVVVSRAGHPGKLRIRWYKVAAGATIDGWAAALAARDPAPLAVVGGWTSDRAHELARALAARPVWRGDRPLLFITTATVDTVLGDPNDPGGFAPVSEQKNLTEVYAGRSFRLCFSNSQMVRAVTDFVLRDPVLHPGAAGWPRLRAVGGGAVGPWGVMGDLADVARKPTVFPLEWKDDPYSADLYNQFREHLFYTLGGDNPRCAPRVVTGPAFSIPFTVGGFTRPNAGEAAAVREILRDLPPPGERSLLVIPTVSSAARRVLLALSERVPQAGRRLVAVTGDGIAVNTFYRDAEWAWPARSIPIPLVLFTHQNPFGWDAPGDDTPPRGYRLDPKTTTEEVLLYTTLGRMLADGVFPPAAEGQGNRTVTRADEVAVRLRTRPDRFFDDRGNRRGLSGEHVVVVRPTVRYGDTAPGTPKPESTIEVYRRDDGGPTWRRAGAVQVHPDWTDDRRGGE